MNNTPLLPVFASSQDPSQISTTVTGFIIAASSYVILLASIFFHVTLTASDVSGFASDLGYEAGAIAILVGLAHKVIQKFGHV